MQSARQKLMKVILNAGANHLHQRMMAESATLKIYSA
jgi:hypothetical protein